MNNFSCHDVVLPFVNASSGDQDKMHSLLEILKELRTKSKIEDVTTERDNPDHTLTVLRSDMPDKNKANINWLMSDKFIHKDTARRTNTILLGGFSG